MAVHEKGENSKGWRNEKRRQKRKREQIGVMQGQGKKGKRRGR